MPLPRRRSYIVFVDSRPVAARMASSADDALAYAREWAHGRDAGCLAVVPEADCTPEQIAQYNAHESARCAEWGVLAKCIPFGDDLVILAERLDPAPAASE